MTNEVRIVDDNAEGETADYVVCARLTQPLLLPDNLIDLCCRCGEAIQHRPDAPKKPPKVCLTCIEPDLKKEMSKEDLHVMVTPKTMRDVAAFVARKNAN